MSADEESLALPRLQPGRLAALQRVVAAPRFLVYLFGTILVVLTSYHLGKEMLWDTMDYHVYAGFSALHDRFGRDYFAAGPQGYFNPYAYVPFYLLLRSPLTPLEDASILAVFQSGILWLTYELAVRVAPSGAPKARVAIGVLAVALAFANPVLINEIGSSYADITTAEVALAGWLILLAAIAHPGAMRIVWAALLLGAASALKPTNAVHAVSATAMLPFIPGSWRDRCRYAALFALGLTVGFTLLNAPWSIHLERHFGNPVFPLLNDLFRSPEYSTGSMLDHRFIPASLGAALLRPFVMVAPVTWIDFEMPAPDLRYALLLALALLLLLQQAWRRVRGGAAQASQEHVPASRALTALGCAFLVDWILWLTVSGNSRYFLPAACVAAVLCIVLIFRLFAGRPKERNYLLVAVFGVQLFQLYAGTEYRNYLPWHNGSWYGVSVPAKLASQANLYFMLGGQTNSFIIPDLPPASGFINLDGGYYALGPDGPNGRRIAALIRRYEPNLRVLWRDPRIDADRQATTPNLEFADDALAPFGLKAQAGHCAMIVAHGVDVMFTVGSPAAGQRSRGSRARDTEYLETCHVIRDGASHPTLPGQRAADLAFDHLEDACPALFQPRRPADSLVGDRSHGYVFTRNYPGTEVQAWIGGGSVRFEKLAIGGREEDAGREKMWEKGPSRVACGWRGAGFLKVLSR